MCSNCKDLLGRKTLKHDQAYCPIAKSRYCGICARYGHTTLCCPDKEALQYRKPTCLEQLVPDNLLEAYNVMTNTPLSDPLYTIEPIHTPVLEVTDTEKNIRAMLISHGKSEKGKPRDLRIRLSKLADELHLKLVYIKPPPSAE